MAASNASNNHTRIPPSTRDDGCHYYTCSLIISHTRVSAHPVEKLSTVSRTSEEIVGAWHSDCLITNIASHTWVCPVCSAARLQGCGREKGTQEIHLCWELRKTSSFYMASNISFSASSWELQTFYKNLNLHHQFCFSWLTCLPFEISNNPITLIEKQFGKSQQLIAAQFKICRENKQNCWSN